MAGDRRLRKTDKAEDSRLLKVNMSDLICT
jgi:hypothetical protein